MLKKLNRIIHQNHHRRLYDEMDAPHLQGDNNVQPPHDLLLDAHGDSTVRSDDPQRSILSGQAQ